MQYKVQIHNYVQNHKDEIVETLKELIKIPSVRSEVEENAPFGKECARLLRLIEQLYKDNGFETELDSNGGYLLSYYGKGEKTLGIFAHADVVSVGDDWVLSKPFESLEKDGCLIGRGTLDDKSAVVISLYCAKILKELNIPFGSRLIMFTGSNEESGMQDIKNYISAHTPPDFSLVADTGFPAYRGDKGILRFIATSPFVLKEIDNFRGGTAFNIILGEATAKYKDQVIAEKGISKHGALPEGSLNAGYLLAKKLLENKDLCKEDKTQIGFVADTLEKYYGEVFGIENNDPVFGRLTCTNGIVETNDQKFSLCFDMRYGMSVDIEDAKSKIIKYFAENGWSVEFVKQRSPFCVSEDNPYLVSCLEVYKSFTGAKNATVNINAGGTYAAHLPCAIEIGTTLSQNKSFNLPSGHGGAHQPDEYININGLLQAIELTALMLLECDKLGEL